MTKNYSDREYKEKVDMVLGGSNTSNLSNNNFVKKRKDPKSMTTEELEEYINKNRSERGDKNENKSLNSSFQSQKNLNYSFTGLEKIGGVKKDLDVGSNNNVNNSVNKELKSLNFNYNNLPNSNSTINLNMNNMNNVHNPFTSNLNPNLNNTGTGKSSGNLNNLNNLTSLNNLNNLNNSSNLNNFPNLNNNNNNYQNAPQKENLITNNSNISIDPMSDGEEKYLKFKSKVFPGGNLQNSQTQFNSNNSNCNNNLNNNQMTPSPATNNYIKSLQEKNKFLLIENEELKNNFVEVSEILEKERHEFQRKLINEINKTTELEKNYKNEIFSLENENKHLVNEVNELRMKLSLLNTNYSILENEKVRHLEQNSEEKENLQGQIDSILADGEENKKQLVSLINENNILREKLQKDNDDISNLEKNIQILKEENISLNRKIDDDRDEYISNVKNFKDIIKQLEHDKRDLTKKYESNIKELTHRLNKLEIDAMKNNKYSNINVNSSYIANTPKLKKSNSGNSNSNLTVSRSKEKIINLNSNSKLKTKKSTSNSKTNMKINSPCSHINIKNEKKKVIKKKKSVDFKNKENKSILKRSAQSDVRRLSPTEYLSPIQSITNTLNSNFVKSPTGNQPINLYDDFLDGKNIINNDNYELLSTRKNDQLNQINDMIFDLERNIADLNRNYKNLMIKLNTSISPDESNNLKRNINIIANNLQDHSEKLVDLKNKQQELLKTSVRI